MSHLILSLSMFLSAFLVSINALAFTKIDERATWTCQSKAVVSARLFVGKSQTLGKARRAALAQCQAAFPRGGCAVFFCEKS